MAKKSRSGRVQRDPAAIASSRLLVSRPQSLYGVPVGDDLIDALSAPLTEVEDNRTFHPNRRFRSGVTVSGRAVELTVNAGPFRFGGAIHRRSVIARNYYTGMPVGVQVPVGIKFHEPLKVVTCIRRAVRRSVMFAKRKVGLGARQKVRRRGPYTGVKC
nr:MAG: hypothetical protein [Microvirus sp.]